LEVPGVGRTDYVEPTAALEHWLRRTDGRLEIGLKRSLIDQET